MKVDPNLLKVVAGLGDEELWVTIRSIAGMKKIRLTEETPPKATLDAIRAAIKDADKIDLGDALQLIRAYREKK